MKSRIQVKRTRYHSSCALMRAHFQDDGTFLFMVADRNSDDTVVLELDQDEIERMKKALLGPIWEEFKNIQPEGKGPIKLTAPHISTNKPIRH